MNPRLIKFAIAVPFAWLALYGLEKYAEAQSTTTTTSGSSYGSSGGSSLLSGGMSGGSTISGGSTVSGSSSNGQSFSGGEPASFSGGGSTRGGTRGSGSASGTTVPAASNVFGPNYMNPFSLGIKSSSGTMQAGTFNQPIYAPKTATSTARTSTNRSTNTSNSNTGFNTQGMDRTASGYVTGLSEDLPLFRPMASALQAELHDIIQRSSAVTNKDSITVAVNGDVVTIRGEVASERERRQVEGLLRLEPGVSRMQVDNLLTVTGKTNP